MHSTLDCKLTFKSVECNKRLELSAKKTPVKCKNILNQVLINNY